VAVVTDNDGDPAALDKKYASFKGEASIRICFDPEIDTGSLKVKDKPFNYNTLEPKILKANGLGLLNEVLETDGKSEDDLRLYMRSNKTEAALAIFSSTSAITYPDYILRAIAP
jgi:putative ATP-dependent endonuclease of OLD family